MMHIVNNNKHVIIIFLKIDSDSDND
jgi:hypothetical protein